MRTTLKRGVGRSADVNGGGHPVFPPGPVSAVTRYRAEPRPERSGLIFLRRILIGTVLAIVALALGIGGGAYLWFDESVEAIQAHSSDVVAVQKTGQLEVPLPGEPAVALVLGYDARPGETVSGSRSDTIMLLRADPHTKTISMLSFPRDLSVPIWCNHREYGSDKINSAFAKCPNGPQGTLETVKKLTGIDDINYLIMVNFHGFRELVDQFGGIWLDVDRRYYNKNTGADYNNYANINLMPGYQRLAGGAALDFVRFRHTDADFYRLARQQQFVRAFKEQIAQGLNLLDVPKIVKTITKNIEVGGNPSDRDVIDYAYLAATLPDGHVLQVHLDRNQISEGGSDLLTSSQTVQEAVGRFVNPDVGVAKIANATALGVKTTRAPLPKDTTVTVLNGNGVAGSAANASYLLGQKGYVTMRPPNGAEPNTPVQNYFETKIYFKKSVPGSRAAALALKKRFAPAKVAALPARSPLRALDPGSMLLVALGTTFPGHLVTEAPSVVPTRQLPVVRADATPGRQLLEPLQKRVPFPLQVPTVLERTSNPDIYDGDKAVHFYRIDPDRRHKAVRLVFKTGANEYWGIQETDWDGAPVLSDKSFRHAIGGRSFDLYYSGPHLHMAVLHANGASYWVVNTLLDSLSNETMIAIAKGLKPLGEAP